jgi:hypothetical protein
MDIKHLSQSKTFRVAVIVTGVLLVALLSFSAGVNVGLRKAKFSYAFGEQYERNFSAGPLGVGRGTMMGAPMMPFADLNDRDFRNGHGLAGEVISVSDGSLVVKDVFGNENTISVDGDLLVKNGRNDIQLSDLTKGTKIIVIGKPGDNGMVEAEFIRVIQ